MALARLGPPSLRQGRHAKNPGAAAAAPGSVYQLPVASCQLPATGYRLLEIKPHSDSSNPWVHDLQNVVEPGGAGRTQAHIVLPPENRGGVPDVEDIQVDGGFRATNLERFLEPEVERADGRQPESRHIGHGQHISEPQGVAGI